MREGFENMTQNNRAKCSTHGLVYDPSKHTGCVLCRKEKKTKQINIPIRDIFKVCVLLLSIGSIAYYFTNANATRDSRLSEPVATSIDDVTPSSESGKIPLKEADRMTSTSRGSGATSKDYRESYEEALKRMAPNNPEMEFKGQLRKFEQKGDLTKFDPYKGRDPKIANKYSFEALEQQAAEKKLAQKREEDRKKSIEHNRKMRKQREDAAGWARQKAIADIAEKAHREGRCGYYGFPCNF